MYYVRIREMSMMCDLNIVIVCMCTVKNKSTVFNMAETGVGIKSILLLESEVICILGINVI